jgi:prepilin-type processing-associated H-X9-DG protein
MGELVEIQSPEQVSGYVEVLLTNDGYKGWMAASYLCRTPDDLNHQSRQKITVATTIITAAPDVKSAPLASLSMGAIVKVEGEQDSYTKVSLSRRMGRQKIGYLPSHTLSPAIKDAEARAADWPAFGEKFLGVPYKWGGRSAAGLDCSALLQLSLAAAGFNVPRDSTPQHAFMKPAAKTQDARFKEYQRGDVLFWDGHVGICVSSELLLHANAYHASVAIEKIEQAINRIKSHFGEPTEHIDGALLLKLF